MKVSISSLVDKNHLSFTRVLDIPSDTLYEVIGGEYAGNIVTRRAFNDRLINVFPIVEHYDEDDCLSGKFRKLPSGFVVKIEQE